MELFSFDKPKKTSAELVEQMRTCKGIKFNIMSREEAALFLTERSNYFRVASYRKNWPKYQNGVNRGKYIDLEFAYLVELSVIDMHLRALIVRMCLDVEHYLKVQLLDDVSQNEMEDGYDIVTSFLDEYPYISGNIERKQTGTYCGDLIKYYFRFYIVFDRYEQRSRIEVLHRCPIWVLVEIISFGDFIKLYEYYYNNYESDHNYSGLLNAMKSLRNACAHNNCIIYNFRRGKTRPSSKITRFIGQIGSIGKEEAKTKLSCQCIYEFVCLIYLYDHVVPDNVKKHRYSELDGLANSIMVKHADYFKNNSMLISSYNFFKKIVDFLN